MSLDYAILGFLNYQPCSGYDLKKLFDTSVRHFWQADQSQIYRTLARLLEQGLAEQEIIEQDDRPDRKVYHITGPGRQALRNWLVGPPDECGKKGSSHQYGADNSRRNRLRPRRRAWPRCCVPQDR